MLTIIIHARTFTQLTFSNCNFHGILEKRNLLHFSLEKVMLLSSSSVIFLTSEEHVEKQQRYQAIHDCVCNSENMPRCIWHRTVTHIYICRSVLMQVRKNFMVQVYIMKLKSLTYLYKEADIPWLLPYWY